MPPATNGPQHVANRLLPLSEPVVVTTPEAAPAREWVTARSAIVALILVGIVLRAVPLLQNRCLWIDEAMLALNLVERSPRQLLQPLDWNQGAPAGFLMLSKAAIAVLGPEEWALRFVPFVGSVFGVIAFAWLARRLLLDPAAVIAVGLFAVSPFLISYAAECKQYATDAAIAVGLFAVAVGLLHGESSFRRWAALAAAGAAAVWFSHPVAFVLGGIGTALFAEAVLAKDRRRAGAAVVTIACWMASFGLCYVTTLKQLGNNQYLLDYWAGHFLPLPPASQGDLIWLADHFFGFLAYPGGLGGAEVKAGGIAAALALVGLVAIWRERWPVAVALVVPALLALLASGLHKYPFAGRLLLFLVPLLLLVVAHGAWVVASALRPGQPFAATVLLGLLLLAPAIETYQTLRRPPRYEQITPILAEVREQWQPGDKVYIYYGAVPAFTFYTRENPFPPGVVLGTEYREGRIGYRDELRRLAGHARVWIVFSHRHRDEESLVRAYAEGLGRCEREVRQPGATAFLFDFRDTR
jgi:Dolichyl-phosphate-mannose-protein mannosyltransferase